MRIQIKQKEMVNTVKLSFELSTEENCCEALFVLGTLKDTKVFAQNREIFNHFIEKVKTELQSFQCPN